MQIPCADESIAALVCRISSRDHHKRVCSTRRERARGVRDVFDRETIIRTQHPDCSLQQQQPLSDDADRLEEINASLPNTFSLFPKEREIQVVREKIVCSEKLVMKFDDDKSCRSTKEEEDYNGGHSTPDLCVCVLRVVARTCQVERQQSPTKAQSKADTQVEWIE